MDLDPAELDRYIVAGNQGYMAEPTQEEKNEAAGNMQMPQMGTEGIDVEAVVQESARRRQSMANAYGMGYLSMEDQFGQMLDPQQAYNAAMATPLLPTTMEEMMDLSATAQMQMVGMPVMGAYGGFSTPEIVQNLSVFSDPNMAPVVSQPSPIMPSPQHTLPHSPMKQGPMMGGNMGGAQLGESQMGQMRGSPLDGQLTGSQMGTLGSQLMQTSSSTSRSPMSSLSSPLPPTTMEQNDMQGLMFSRSQGPTPKPPQQSSFPENVYSSSGFDMLDILNRVATRPNPEINIGAVDLSCCFVVTDARKFDNPIVYCSATFERLTGYNSHEVLGKNCRFLQAPDGRIKAGEKRKYVDENAVYYLKSQISNRREAQTSLINYRKGGQSFTNLLTMIPIRYNPEEEITYFVGFQVDLVDQPGALSERNKDGSYAVNYQYSQLPTYIPAAASALMMEQRPRLTVARDDVSQVLSSFGAASDSELHVKRILDKVLLENTDDVVHVLSLKGLFLYCSPSIRKVLEYDAHELVGTSLSGVCHPSDIVPVTRDLKDTSAGTSVNVVFRIRRKYSGYTWFESHGCLHTEQGKGRKCIILVGRERPVYVLPWKEVNASGGVGENELWSKMSTTGMFLFVSSNSKMLLDRESDDLIGTSVQALMRPDSKNELERGFESARTGSKACIRHELQNRRGQFLQVMTILYPGDGNEDQKPSFLIAQMKMLKHTRGALAAAATSSPSGKTPAGESSHGSTPTMWSGTSSVTTNATTVDRDTGNKSRENSAESNADDNMFEELKSTRSTSWQFELRQMQRTNKRLTEDLQGLLSSRKKRKRRKGADQQEKDCANCHTRVTPEWRRGPSGKRDLCNSCGLRYAKIIGRGSSRTGASNSDKGHSPIHTSSPTATQCTTMENISATSTPANEKKQQHHTHSDQVAGPLQNPLLQNQQRHLDTIPAFHDALGRRGSMGAFVPKLPEHIQQRARRLSSGTVPLMSHQLSQSTSADSIPYTQQQPPPLPHPPGGGGGSGYTAQSSSGGAGNFSLSSSSVTPTPMNPMGTSRARPIAMHAPENSRPTYADLGPRPISGPVPEHCVGPLPTPEMNRGHCRPGGHPGIGGGGPGNGEGA